jgi:hypothetical protein
MSNLNSIYGYVGGTARNQIVPLTLASATETAFSIGTDAGTSSPAILTVPGAGPVGSGTSLEFNLGAAHLGPSYGRKVGVQTAMP